MGEMLVNEDVKERFILIGVQTADQDGLVSMEDSLVELEELVQTAGGDSVACVVQNAQRIHPGTYMGSGKLEEVRQMLAMYDADGVVCDDELSPAQMNNLERILECKVLDRTMVILDIFAARARSSEGKIQVELAQLRYRAARLVGMRASLSRLGGGIGTRGPGESKLESDRRHIRRRIHSLEEELKELEKRRGLLRQRRKKDDVISVAIVGYTNVGKSTLLNTLTDAGVLAKDMLFATLDPTSRALTLPDGRKVMLIDTVGLVSRLPHQLVQAFHSTLEEAADADLILNVCDVSSPEFDQQLEVTTGLLRELGAENVPVLTVLNKCDKLPELPMTLNKSTAAISAKTGMGLEKLLEKIVLNLPETHRHLHLLIPYDKSGLIGEIRQSGKVYTEEYREDGTFLDANVDLKICHRIQDYILLNEE